MGITSTLLNARRRPEAEASRITDAVVEALVASRQGHDSDTDPSVVCASAASGAADAFDRTNHEIADEKAPRRVPAPSQHLSQFGALADEDDNDADRFDVADEQAVPRVPTHRLDARYLLDDDDETDPSPEQESVAAPASPVAEAAATPPPPPWAQDPVRTAGASLDGDVPETTAVAHVDVPGEEGTPEPGDDVDGDAPDVDGHGNADDAVHELVDTRPPAQEPVLAPWERDRAAAASPWGDAVEIVPTAMVADPEPLVSVDTDGNRNPDSDADDNGGVSDPEPSQTATEPPDTFDEPPALPRVPLSERIRDWGSRQRWKNHFAGPRGALKALAYGGAAVVAVVVFVLTLIGGGRGEPPVPAGQVAPPPAQTDTAETERSDGPLIPATVSASCGNDSDAVAPFSHDRTRAWVCRRINGRDLNVLNITFDQPVVISSITVVPGFAYVAPDGRDEWSRHRLVTSVAWRMGGAVYPQNIAPTRTGVTQQFPNVITQELSMTITSSTRPPLGEDANTGGFAGAGDADDPAKVDEHTAVSQIVITGHPVDPGSSLTPNK